MINKINKNYKLLNMLIKGIYKIIISNKHSYNKNTVILPYHRVFA